MPDLVSRGILAVGIAIVVGYGLIRLDRIPRDIALTLFGGSVAVLGIFAFFGTLPAIVGGAVIVGVAVVGAAVYAVSRRSHDSAPASTP